MKREGRQHGMVRTYRILPDTDGLTNYKPRFVNQIHTQPTAGMFTKVSTKPTNHSKSSGLGNSSKSKHRNHDKERHAISKEDSLHYSGVSASRVLSSFYHEYEDQETNDALDHHDYGFQDEITEVSGKDTSTVIDLEGGTVTIGEMASFLTQINEEDWCVVPADA